MNKFSKLVKVFSLILQKPYLLNNVLKDEIVFKADFKKAFPSTVFKQIRLVDLMETDEVQIKPYAFLSGSSLATDFALLQLLCRKYQVKDYLEIGTWRGESAANVAPYVDSVISFNLGDEQLLSLGLEKNYVESHRYFSKDISNIQHVFGDSQHFDFDQLNKKFDLIFIDGDHSTEAVKRDTEKMLSYLKNDQSIIVWHDAKVDTEYPRFEVLLGIYQALPSEMQQHVYLVENSLCAVYLPMNVSSESPVLNRLPRNYFELTLMKRSV
ncbi:MAG: class I SAM-dependent methyltransferase [Flavobacteriia bacterium]